MMTVSGLALAVATFIIAVALGAGARRVLGSDPLGRVEEGFLVLGFGWALMGWWGVVLAETRNFTPAGFLVPPAILAVAMLVGAPKRGLPAWSRPDREALAALCLTTVVAFWFFLPAFDVQLEARDPGTYFHAGKNLARSGALTWHDETVTRLDSDAQAYFFPSVGPERAHRNSRYMGFYLEDISSGRVVPQALPIYPVWVAVADWIAGSPAALASGGVLLWLAACGLSLLGAAMCGRLGLLAGPLIAAGVITGWFARFSAAESAAQLLVVLGGLALLRYRQERGRFYGVAAALGFGLLPLAKAEMLVVLLPLAVLLLADVVTARLRTEHVVLFWAPVGALGMHSLWHAVGWLWPYYHDILRQYRLTPAVFLGVALVAGLGGVAFLGVAYRASRGRAEAIRIFLDGESPRGHALRLALAGAVVVLTAAGYWLRPWLWLRDEHLVDPWNMGNHFELGLGISPVLVFLAALGAAILIARRDQIPGVAVVAFVLISISAMILWERNIIPRPMWAFRRYLPVVLPASYLLGMVAITTLARAGTRWRVPAVVTGAVLLAPVLAHHATAATWIKAHTELPGSAVAVQALAQNFRPEDVVLFEPRNKRGLVRFEAAIGLDGPTVYRLPSVDIDPAAILRLAQERTRVGGEVYLVTTGMVNGLAGLHAEPVAVFEWSSDVLEEFYPYSQIFAIRTIRLPRVVNVLRVSARVYRLRPSLPSGQLTEAVADEQRRLFDIGLWDDAFINGATLHQSEIAAAHNFRWTRAESEFLLLDIPLDVATVALRVAENELRPAQTVEAWLDGVALGSAPVPGRWGDVQFAVPDSWIRPADGIGRFVIRVPTVVPQTIDPDHKDPRELGIRVDKVAWLRAEQQFER